MKDTAMTFRAFTRRRLLPGALGLALAGLLPMGSAFAAATVNKGDTTWMLIATILVILMTIPGLALFYGGLVRTKNVLSVLTQVFICFSLIGILWVLYGYSIAFTGGTAFFGGLSKFFLAGVDVSTLAATFSKEVYVPELSYVMFQLTFAAITPALIVGAFAERMKFSAVLLFLVLWFTFAYLPMAHMVWFWAGPDAYTLSADNLDAVKAAVGEQAATDFLAKLAAATDDAAKATVLADYGNAVNASNGWLFNWGALDFAGGTVVHINAGVAGLVCALVLGKRVGYGKDADGAAQPHPHFDRRLAALGRLVWLQCRLQSRGQRSDRAGRPQYDHRHRRRGAGLDLWRMGDARPSELARRRVGCGGGSRRHHAGLRLGRAGGGHPHRPHRRSRLPVGRRLDEGEVRL